MKVLILGATGFIGFPAAQAFVRNGHEVYGQTRSADKAKLLTQEEIIPVIADPLNGKDWEEIAGKADIVIDCIGGMDIYKVSKYVFEVATEAAKKARGTTGPKMTYIYTGGTWVHGEDRVNTTSERSPIKNTTAIVAWRPEQEQRVLTSSVVDGIVIRPALLYGRSGSILSMLFPRAQKGQELMWTGRKGGRWPVIHADDLARLFVLVGEAAPICKGLVFDAANDHTESVDDILEQLTKVSGASGWKYVEPSNPFEEAIATTTLLRPSLARALVGWRPLKAGVVDGLKTYYEAWKASA